MENQIISAVFFDSLPPGLYYELSDDTGIQSAGPVVAGSMTIEMSVSVNPLVETAYALLLKDGDGAIKSCKFSHSVGGIVTVKNQTICANFFTPLPSGLIYELFEGTELRSTGPVAAGTTSIDMDVIVDSLIIVDYTLELKDSDGASQNCKFSHSDGGIVIVNNVDIDTKEPTSDNPKLYAQKASFKRKLTRMS